MKIRYQCDEGGCFGSVNEVAFFPKELLEGKATAEIQQIIQNQISQFGCSGCIDYEEVNEDVDHQWVCTFDQKWKTHLLSSVEIKEEDHSV